MHDARVLTASYDDWFEMVYDKVPNVCFVDIPSNDFDVANQGMHAYEGNVIVASWMPNNQYFHNGVSGNCWIRLDFVMT